MDWMPAGVGTADVFPKSFPMAGWTLGSVTQQEKCVEGTFWHECTEHKHVM